LVWRGAYALGSGDPGRVNLRIGAPQAR